MTKPKYATKGRPRKYGKIESQIREEQEKKDKKRKNQLSHEQTQEILKEIGKGQSDIMLRYKFKLDSEDLRRLERQYGVIINWVTNRQVYGSAYSDREISNVFHERRRKGEY